MTDSTGTSDAEALREALVRYRDAAEAWLDSVGRLGISERQVADRLAIGRMILNRMRRFVQADDLISLLEHLPGARARGEVLETPLPDRLNADEVTRRLQQCTREIDAVMARVGTDREQARRLLASIDDASQRRVIADDRQSLFEAESRLQGVDAETIVGSILVAPASDGRSCNIAALQLIGGLQAHRPAVDTTIYMALNGYADLRHDGFPVNLDPDADEPLLRKSDTGSILHRELHSSYEFLRYRLRDDPPLHRRFNFAFGEIHPQVGPMEGTEEDDIADFVLPIFFPVRHAAMELWLHRDLRRAAEPPQASFPQNSMLTPHLGSDMQSPLLPRTGDVSRIENPIEASAGLVSFSDLRRELLDRAANRLEVSLADFEVHRAAEPHPPPRSGIRMFWRLASPPDACT